MKTKTILILVLAMVLLATALFSQALSVDSRKIPIQLADNFSAQRYSCSADTLYNRVTVPSYAVEAYIIAETGAVNVCADSTYIATSAFPKNYASVPAASPFIIPVKQMTKFYIRRAAAGTATTVNIVWKKL